MDNGAMPRPGSGRRVLVVDDEAGIRDVVRRVLEADGYDADLCASGEAAYERLKNSRYDVVLSDISMPGSIDGMALASIVRREFPETEVILMTGHPEIQTTIRALEEGVLDFLIKPIAPENLLAVVRRWGRERALREALKDANSVLESCVASLLESMENLSRDELMGTAKKRAELVIEKARKLEALAASLKKAAEEKGGRGTGPQESYTAEER